MPFFTFRSSSAQSAISANSGTARPNNSYYGPVEDRDGDFDIDSSVCCTDLMTSTTISGNYDDPVTGWSEESGKGGTPRHAGANKKGRGGLMRLLKRGKKKSKNNKCNDKSKASGAAAIALAAEDAEEPSSAPAECNTEEATEEEMNDEKSVLEKVLDATADVFLDLEVSTCTAPGGRVD